MQQRSGGTSLWNSLDGHDLSRRTLSGVHSSVALLDLLHGSALAGSGERLRGRSVLISTADQLPAALALMELDGIARRLVLCPPDLPSRHLAYVMEAAGVDAIVSDGSAPALEASSAACYVACDSKISPASCDRSASHQTEWILLTSGTTGAPKLVLHTLASLAGAIQSGTETENQIVWSTFYDIRRYGGLQIFLRAILTGTSMVLSNSLESATEFLTRASSHGVTHISGTPSHWRRALMSDAAHLLRPRYVRLSGEIADQTILNQLGSFYPQARVSHAFASTEAGVAFDVRDGQAGFPAQWIGQTGLDVEMKVEEGSLRIRSSRSAASYVGNDNRRIQGEDGFVDTGDMIERRGDRYYFVGRRDGVINVGGLKVHPEEIEAVINGHPQVRMSLVRTRKNSITGALVVADIVLKEQRETVGELQAQILRLCQSALPRHKVPAVVNFVPTLNVAATGKIARRHA